MKEGRCRAFTLVELLVVFAIVAILASLLLPAIARAKGLAQDAKCIGNQRQFAIGMGLFVSDHQAYPLGVTVSAIGAISKTWADDIGEYTNARWPENNTSRKTSETGLFACPSYNRVSGFYWRSLPSIPFASPGGAYAYNYYGVGGTPLEFVGGPSSASYRGVVPGLGLGGEQPSVLTPISAGVNRFGSEMRAIADGRVLNPSGMISFGDSVIANRLLDERLIGLDDLSTGPTSPYTRAGSERDPELAASVQAMAKRHSGRFVVSFADGHAEKLNTRALFDSRNPARARRWNNDHLPHLERAR